MAQSAQMAELFATSKQTISHYIANILKDNELKEVPVVKNYLTTAADGEFHNMVLSKKEIATKNGSIEDKIHKQ